MQATSAGSLLGPAEVSLTRTLPGCCPSSVSNQQLAFRIPRGPAPSRRRLRCCVSLLRQSSPLAAARLRCCAVSTPSDVPRLNSSVDDQLSQRPLDLDPEGYFIIKLDRAAVELVVEHYTNTISKSGLACDPDTGLPIPCTPGNVRLPRQVFRGVSAKAVSVDILERESPVPVSRLEHANYLGRELQRAEMALVMGWDYIQD